MCTLTPEVQCRIFQWNHVIWRTKITNFWRNGNDSKQPNYIIAFVWVLNLQNENLTKWCWLLWYINNVTVYIWTKRCFEGIDFSYLVYIVDCISGVIVSVLASSVVDRVSWLGKTKDYMISIPCFSAKHSKLRKRAKTGWLRIRIMSMSRATCLSVDCCFSEQAL